MALGKIVVLLCLVFVCGITEAQFHYSITANFTEEITDGHSLNTVTKGSVSYSRSNDSLKTVFVYPFSKTVISPISKSSVLYQTLNSKLLSFGADDFNYQITDVSKRGNAVYTEYSLPQNYHGDNDVVSKILLSQTDNRLNAAVLLDSVGKPMIKFFYYDYLVVNGVDFPTQIVTVSYTDGEIYTKTLYSNIVIDNKPPVSFADTFKTIPLNDKTVYQDLLRPVRSRLICEDSSKNLYYGLFAFYKRVISPQDIQRCSFYPSCSQYCFETFSNNGFWYGFADTFDRLLRCNGIHKKGYTFSPQLNLLIDYPLIKQK